MKKFKSIFLVLLLFNACECVPTIETPKSIKPVQFGNVLFINLIDSTDFISIYQNNISVIDSLKNLSLLKNIEEENNISKIGVSLTNISIYNNKSTSLSKLSTPLFSFIAQIELDQYYTAIFYGNNNAVNCIFNQDVLASSLRLEEIKLRFINLSDNDIYFEVENSSHFVEKYNNTTLLYCNNISFITIKDNEQNILEKIECNFSGKYMYNIIYKNKTYISKYSLEV